MESIRTLAGVPAPRVGVAMSRGVGPENAGGEDDFGRIHGAPTVAPTSLESRSVLSRMYPRHLGDGAADRSETRSATVPDQEAIQRQRAAPSGIDEGAPVPPASIVVNPFGGRWIGQAERMENDAVLERDR